jgi:serine/threonine-protein kinase
LESAINRFVSAWGQGPRPVIDDYLPADATRRRALLIELVHTDLELRLKAGEPARAEEYLARYPELAGNTATLVELIAAEYRLRRRGEPDLSLDDYLRRFPQCRTELPEQVARPTVVGGDAPGRTDSNREAVPEVDGYEILAPLGRGGMGVVYRAWDTHLGREVAVKVMLDGHHNHRELHQRFVEEARVAGQLQHPGVVPVYALGEAGPGRPCFAMKLVEGRTLAALLHERATPLQELPRFLKVFEAVCQAVAYAHSKGVIHRDLKPANVMVGAFAEVQVMDWVLAKVLGAPPAEAAEAPPAARPVKPVRGGSPHETEPGSVLGTYAYMAPEQARGEVASADERCDVFGLGALLCEILTGQPPYGGPDPAEVQRQARQGDLAAARARLDGCAAEAEWVALARACLAVERDERPRHAGVVAEAVAAHLARVAERLRAAEIARATAEVARAAAQTRAEAERKRRRLTAALAAAVLALAAVGGGGAWWLAEKQAAAEREVGLAYREARGLHERARAAQVGDTLAWTRAVDAARHADALLAGGWVAESRRQEVADLRRQVEAEHADIERDRHLLVRLAEIRTSREDAFALTSIDIDYERAFREYGLDLAQLAAAQAAERIRARPPQVVTEVTAALDYWALERRQRQRPEAEWRYLLDVARLADPDPWRQELRAAVGGPDREAVLGLADRADLARLPVQSLQLLALMLHRTGADRRAEAVLRAALVRFPGDVWLNYALAQSLHDQKPPRLAEAICFYTAARAVRPEIGLRLGYALQSNGDKEGAVALFRELARLRPENIHNRFALGKALASQGKHREAVEAFEIVLRSAPGLAFAHLDLGTSLVKLDRLDEAIAAFRKAILHRPDFVIAHFNLARALQDQGQYQEAVTAFQQVLRYHPADAGAHNNLGNVLSRLDRLDEAVKSYRSALQYQPANPGYHFNLGKALSQLDRLDEAVKSYREALHRNPNFAVAHLYLGLALQQQGQLALALVSLKRAHQLGSPDPAWPYPSARWVGEVEYLVKIEARLPAFLRGEAPPTDNTERLGLARLCHDGKRRLHRTAAHLFAEAFAAQAALADDVRAGHRSEAARAAALAGCGQGEDAVPDGPERARWRQQSLEWMRAELAAYTRLVESGKSEDRLLVRMRLQPWNHSPGLAGLRDAAVPEPERDGWRRLWADVTALLGRASAPR